MQTEKNQTQRPETVEAHLLSTWLMGCGEGKPNTVIEDNTVMQYVGIGWIRLRQASEEDYRQYPVVVRNQNFA